MEFSLKPHQLVAHLVPGIVFLAIILLCDLHNGSPYFSHITGTFGKAPTLLALVVLGFPVGQVLDAIRNLFDEFIGWIWKQKAISWDFLWKSSKEEQKRMKQMEAYYFTYLVFDFNTALALILGEIVSLVPPGFPKHIPLWALIVMGIAAIILVFDWWNLRKDFLRYAKDANSAASNTSRT